MNTKVYNFSLILLLGASTFLSSCGSKSTSNESPNPNSKATQFAKELCGIAKEIGLDESFKLDEKYLQDNASKMEDKFYSNSDKLMTTLKSIDTHLKTLNQAQSQLFAKELMKAIIDTDCSNIFFKEIPYAKFGDLIKDMEKDITRMKYRKDNPESDYSMYPDATMSEEPYPY